MASRVVPSLPRIQVPVGIKPQQLKLAGVENPKARMEVLRALVCDLFREERIEIKHNRAVECQPYAERLLQLAVRPGASQDEYTREMLGWWLAEHADLHDKLFDVLVPRFTVGGAMPTSAGGPFTALYRLPKVWVPGRKSRMNQQYHGFTAGVLELRGNPFPSVEPLEQRRRDMLKEMVKRGINEDRYR